MDAVARAAAYRRLRGEPAWRLLRSDQAPTTLALLQRHLWNAKEVLSVAILAERIAKDLEELRDSGFELPQTAQLYIAKWVADGYLVRRLPAGANEEVIELTAAAARAIRIADGLVEKRVTATESRLANVIHQLVRLAEETNPDEESRVAALLAERDRIDQEIAQARAGGVKTLRPDRALERAREIIALADELAADFRNVRDSFEQLNRDLRQQLLDQEGSRGAVLDSLFAGVDVIAESEAGRTFTAFWRLLTDVEQSNMVEQAVGAVMQRDFAASLEQRERSFLVRLIMTLLEQGGSVHEVLQNFARSLKQFVQSREYLEQRQMNQLLNEASCAALELKERLRSGTRLDMELRLSTSTVKSLAQWTLYDPAENAVAKGMGDGEPAEIDLDEIGRLVAESEIDFRELRSNIEQVLNERDQATIGHVMQIFPATQGLGSIVGYIVLGSRHGVRLNDFETVSWEGRDQVHRSGRIPALCFLAERRHELV